MGEKEVRQEGHSALRATNGQLDTFDPHPPKVVEMPANGKMLPCGKCGREILVGPNAVLAYCRDCSATLGVKR